MANDRERLVAWQPDPDALSMHNLARWHVGGTVHALPSKAEFARSGIGSLLDGWLPASPLVGEATRVVTIGSCFARFFVLWLAENGFNTRVDSSPHNALLKFGSEFESPAVIAQQFRWAFGEFSSRDALWIGKDKEIFEATEERRQLVRDTLQQCDVLLVTLGLSEVWYDNKTGEPLWRALTRERFDPSRHEFRTETMHDTKRHLEKIEEIRLRHLPNLKVVFTVSPVRFAATFRPVSAMTANSASKAIIRAALDEFLRERGDRLNRELFYFPSYEIVHDFFRDPFEADNRHIVAFVAHQVVQTFVRHYCEPALLARTTAAPVPTGEMKLDEFLAFKDNSGRDVRADEYPARLASLERRVDDLQRVCDERLNVIQELDAAARDRLALVERLHQECAELREKLAGRG